MSLFNTTNTQTGGGFSFGNPAAQSAKPSVFGNASTQSQPTGFGAFGQQQQTAQPAQSTSIFGVNKAPAPSPFGAQQPAPQQAGGLFSSTAQKPGGFFGASTNQPATTAAQPLQTSGFFSQPQQTNTSLFNKPQTGFGLFGQSQQQQTQQQGQQQQQQQAQAQRPLDQTLRFGTSQQAEAGQNGTPLWEEGRGLGVYRSIPAQMSIIKDKWDPAVLTSPLRTYLYQHVLDEGEALKYRPGPDEDENRWEEAVQKRPGSTWVPLQVRGFFELGKKAQLQMEAIQQCNIMLQEINNSLDQQLDIHRQKVATRLAECKRRHQAATQRTLALAVKVQILRNRGYVMDNAEEELKSKLEKLEREVFDPSLNAREQEVWARMLGIRERAKRLKAEMDKIAPVAESQEPLLDEETIKAAKQTLEAYDIQLRHLQKEMQLVQQEFEDWEKHAEGTKEDRPRRR